jgi:hypothetical protein
MPPGDVGRKLHDGFMQSDREDDSLDERRLYEVAGASQVRWAKHYVQDHQLRRRLS